MRTAPHPVFPVLAAVVALAGCGSSGGGSTKTTAKSTQPPASSAGAGKATPPDVVQKVTAAYQTFIDSNTTVAQSQAALQHGEQFTKTLEHEAKSSNAQKATAAVSSVTLRSDQVADVVFTLKNNGAPLLTDAKGVAVLENGTWKVAAQTFCGLLKLEGTAPKICDDTKITALP